MGSSVTKAKHDERILNPLAMAVRLTLVDCDIAIFIVSYNHHRDRDQVVSLLSLDGNLQEVVRKRQADRDAHQARIR